MYDAIKKIPAPLLRALLNNPYESLVLIDADGVVRFVSESNASIPRQSLAGAVGKHIAEVNPDSELLRTVQTGKAEIGRSLVLDDQERIVARIPLVHEGQVVGAVGKLLLSSPQKLKELYQRIESLEKQLDYFKSQFRQLQGARFTFSHILGRSQPVRDALSLARKAARNDSPLIIQGESGTGKELFAHAIHEAGRRRQNNFIRINCGAIPADLIEAELFGYEPGAFTGARRQGAAGKIELAHNGTLFLDEIGEMPLRMQVKLLRVLQDKVVERIGGGAPRRIDFRLISATNRDLEGMIRKGEFRLDLYYRLNVMSLHLPPLRTIPDDIPLLFSAMLEELAHDQGVQPRTLAPDVTAALAAYGWPGNVRELRNVAERALIVSETDRIELGDLPGTIRGVKDGRCLPVQGARTLKNVVAAAERQAIEEVLQKTRNNKVKAARLLGIHRTGLYQKMNKYGIL